MFFRYPDKFIMPVNLFRKENVINKASNNEVSEYSVRVEYESDKLIWMNIDNYYSKAETGTIYND